MSNNKCLVLILFFFMSCSNVNLFQKFEEQDNFLKYEGLSFITCYIYKELENNKKANVKFKGKKLKIFVDEDKKWINDIPKRDWLIENEELKKNIKTYFKKKNDVISFILDKFYTDEKHKLESKDYISINLQTKLLIFSKIYYDNNQKVFFESTLYGKCVS